MRGLGFVAAAVLALAAGACVKRSTYDAALGENRRLQAEVADAQQKLGAAQQALGDQIKELQARLDALDAATKDKETELGKAQGLEATREKELAELRRQQAVTEQRLAESRAFQDKFRALVDTGKLQVSYRHGQMTLKLPSGILFASGSADLSKAGQVALADVTKILLAFQDRRFLVAGHTDDQPIKTYEFKNNWYLSTARAASVVQFMVKQGFPAQNLGAAGYGEFDPIADNKTDPGREQNRRIEIILQPDLSHLDGAR